MSSPSSSNFEVTCAPEDPRVCPGGSARIECEVGNRSDRAYDLGVELDVEDDRARAWLTLEGDPTFRLEPGQHQSLALTLEVPDDAALDRYEASLLAFDREDPDETFAKSPPITITVQSTAASTPAPRTMPWWVLVVAGVVVLAAVVTVVVVLVQSRAPEPEPEPPPDLGPTLVEVPALLSLDPSQAELRLQQAGLVGRRDQALALVGVEHVTAQAKAAGERVPLGSEVGYTVAVPAVKVPDVQGLRPDDARIKLEAIGLTVTMAARKVSQPGRAPEVVAQDPTAETLAELGHTVTLTYEHSTLRQQSVNASVTLGPEDALLVRSDADVYTDDYTEVRVAYELDEAANHRDVDIIVTMDVRELQGDRSYQNKTHIRTSKKIRVLSLPKGSIVSIDAASMAQSRVHVFQGRLHSWYPFNDVGALEDVEVRFDGRGDDLQYQGLRGRVVFDVVVDEGS